MFYEWYPRLTLPAPLRGERIKVTGAKILVKIIRFFIRVIAACALWLVSLLTLTHGLHAAEKTGAPGEARAILTVRQALKQPESWFHSDAGQRAAENILSHQSPRGSWPKNTNTAATSYTGDRTKLQGTFDNGATTDELRFLARAFNALPEERYRSAFLKGFDHVLEAQYPNGGWPQFHPPGQGYHRYITYNDHAMRRLLEFLREVATTNYYGFIDADRRRSAQRAFDRGIECIVKSQVTVNRQLTVWCAQHDEVTLVPRPARSFELVSLSGAESAGLLLLLMSLEKPAPEVVRAVHAGARWFESARLAGIRQEILNGDKKIVPDAQAPPLWARFYEIDTNRPIFSGRDGVKKYNLAEIEAERRNGYAWYGNWGSAVADRYAAWKSKWPNNPPIQ
jgi:PelA/Pel-15E family pectate lyase